MRRPPQDLDIVNRFFARWEPFEDQRRQISDDLKELFAEAKSEGLNSKALRAAFAERYRLDHQTADEAIKRNANDDDVELYLSALARVRESDTDHDPETGEVIETPADNLTEQTADPSSEEGAGALDLTAGTNSTAASVSEPRLGRPMPGKDASRTVPQASHADTREAVTGPHRESGETNLGATGGRQLQPALRTGVASGAVDTPAEEGDTSNTPSSVTRFHPVIASNTHIRHEGAIR